MEVLVFYGEITVKGAVPSHTPFVESGIHFRPARPSVRQHCQTAIWRPQELGLLACQICQSATVATQLWDKEMLCHAGGRDGISGTCCPCREAKHLLNGSTRLGSQPR